MNSAAILLTMATLGVDVGWQELEDGSIEYIIQIEPQLVGSLKDGADLTSGIRPELRNIRRYRVVVGTDKLPRNPPLEEIEKRLAAAKDEPAPDVATPAEPTPKFEVPEAFREPPPEVSFDDAPKSGGFDDAPAPVANPFGPLRDDSSEPKEEPTPAVDESDEPMRDDSDASNPPSLESDDRAPSTFNSDDTAKPLIKHVAGYSDPTDVTEPKDKEQVAQKDDAESESPVRPWGALTAALLALFASLGLNAFLGWVTVEQRGRYRSLLSRKGGVETVA
ncbi:MAG: hypothetical protein MI757_15110 [Pirellulales bacterium]|nr:hypothetical protein [Pirellulales bacterium]